jgi:hypothetical protein
VVLLYLFIAIAVMSPLGSRAIPETAADDLANHVSGIVEAGAAFREGQFPIQVAPHQIDEARYPIFQFYGNLPYSIGGAIYWATKASPYTTWKIVVGLSIVVGGFFTFCCCRVLTRNALASVASGAVFMTAPYLLTDIHGRAGYPEIVSFGLLPVVFLLAWRSFSSNKPRHVILAGIAWCALSLSHSITYLYASTFFALFFASLLTLSRKNFIRLFRVGVGYVIGLLGAAWYIGPQLVLLPQLDGDLLGSVRDQAWLTSLGVLLAPTIVCPVHVPTPFIFDPSHFGLQVGWPLFVAAGVCFFHRRTRPATLSVDRYVIVRLLLLFAAALGLVWTPLDLWAYLPRIFSYIQFSYRLLMFVVLWGSLLAGYALKSQFGSTMSAGHLAACLLVLGIFMSPYLSPHRPSDHVCLQNEITDPQMGRGGADYAYRLSPAALQQTTWEYPRLDQTSDSLLVLDAQQTGSSTRYGHPTHHHIETTERTIAQLPVLFYPGMVEVCDHGQRVTYGNIDEFIAVELSPGDHDLTTRFVGLRWANWVSLTTWSTIAVVSLFLILRRIVSWLRSESHTSDRSVVITLRVMKPASALEDDRCLETTASSREAR